MDTAISLIQSVSAEDACILNDPVPFVRVVNPGGQLGGHCFAQLGDGGPDALALSPTGRGA